MIRVGGAACAPPAEPRDRLSHANQRMPPQPWPRLPPWAWGGPRSGPRGRAVLPTRRGWKGGRRRPQVHWVFPGLSVLRSSWPLTSPTLLTAGHWPWVSAGRPSSEMLLRGRGGELLGPPGRAMAVYPQREGSLEPKYKLDQPLFPIVDQMGSVAPCIFCRVIRTQ